MSLILDALKKSEQQRQREKTPGLQSIHQPVVIAAKKSSQPWLLLTAIIVICNLVFFGYWFWRQQNIVIQPVVTATSGAPPATQPEQSPPPAQQIQSAKPEEAQAEFTRVSPHESQAQLQSTTSDTAQRIEEISELPDAVRNNLPAMTFSFHVYSETPEQRTIIINDRRVREGDEMSAGLKLQSITPDGVILLFEQHRIHISVLSGW